MSELHSVIKHKRLRSDGPQYKVWQASYDGQDVLEIEALDVGTEDRDAFKAIEDALACLRRARPGSHLVPECRSVPFDDEHGNRTTRLILIMNDGQALATANAAQRSEEEVLRFASSHADLLAELHRAGFSGFRPQLEDIIWRESGQQWTFYGWEGVRRDTRYAVGDLSATGWLWAHLLLGHPAPTTPPLSLFADLDTWRCISLGTRRLLLQLLSPGRDNTIPGPSSPEYPSLPSYAAVYPMQYWQYTPIATADELVVALTAWQSDWKRSKRSPGELLDEAAGFEESQPQRAVDLRDLVERQRPGQIANEAVAVQASRTALENMKKQAHTEYQRADFRNAALLFSRLAGTLTLPAHERLDAWRWYTASDALASEDTDVLSRIGGRTRQELIQKAILTVYEDPQESAGMIGEQANRFSSSQKQLKKLKADFDMVKSCRRAHKELILHPETAAQLYLDASQKLSELPTSYQDALIAVYGDPQRRVESCVRRRLQKEELDGHQRAAEDAKSASNWALAELEYLSAARLAASLIIPPRATECARFDEEAREYESQANRMRLRMQVERLPANAAAEEILHADYAPALEALTTLLQLYPDDYSWAQERLASWRRLLEADFVERPNEGSGAALVALFKNDSTLNDFLSQYVDKLVEMTKQRLNYIREQPALLMTPSDVEARICDTHRHLDQLLQWAYPWLAHIGKAGILEELRRAADQGIESLKSLQHKQKRLAEEYEDALERGEPAHKVRTVLQEARTSGIELYDDSDKTITKLLAALPRSSWEAAHDAHIQLLIAEAHWTAGRPKEALAFYQTVIDNEYAPKKYKDNALIAVGFLNSAREGASPAADVGIPKPLVTLEKINRTIIWTRFWVLMGISLTAVLGAIVLGLILLRGNLGSPPVAQATPAPSELLRSVKIAWLRPVTWTGDVGVGQMVRATLDVAHPVDFTQPLQPIVGIEPEGCLKFSLISRPAAPDRYRWEIVITGMLTCTFTGPALVVASLPDDQGRAEMELAVRPTAHTEEDRWLAKMSNDMSRDIPWKAGQSAVVVGRDPEMRKVKVRLADGTLGWIANSNFEIVGNLESVPEVDF